MTDQTSPPPRPAPPPMPIGEGGPGMHNRVLIPTHGRTPARAPSDLIWDFAGETMSSAWTVRLSPPPGLVRTDVQSAIDEELRRILLLFNQWEPRSELSRFNAAPPGFWAVSEPFWSLLNVALDFADDTNGAIDPTLGALVDLWGFGPPGARTDLPSDDEITAALALSGWGRLRLNRDARAVQQLGGVRLDLSALDRGYAVDRLSERLAAMGATHHLVRIGAHLRGAGVKPDGQPWWVSLEQGPGGPGTRPVAALFDMAMATSGDRVRRLEVGGRTCGHLMDGRTGRPVDNGVASVTVLADTALYADAMATALAVMGPQEGLLFAEALNLAAAFVLHGEDGVTERVTPAYAAMLDGGA